MALKSQSPASVTIDSMCEISPSSVYRILVPMTYGWSGSVTMSSVKVAHWTVSWMLRLWSMFLVGVSHLVSSLIVAFGGNPKHKL